MEKKIVLFTEIFGNGGIEKVIYDINKKYNTINLCINNTTTLYKDIKTINILNKYYKKALIRNILSIIKFKKYFKENECDILHINTHWAFGYIWAFLAQPYVKKIIIHAHNSAFESDKYKLKFIINFLIKKIFYNSKYQYIACSNDAGIFCLGKVDFKIIYNGIDTNKFLYNENKRKEIRKDLKENSIIIGSVGRFCKQKNQKFLIDVFYEILKVNKDAYLIMIGSGNIEEIRNKINNLNIENNVLIIDKTEKIDYYYNAFDFFFLPSLFEGFPLCLLEAQYSNLCCLVSNNIDKNAIISTMSFPLELNVNLWVKTFLKHISYDRENVVCSPKFSLNNFLNEIDKIYKEG